MDLLFKTILPTKGSIYNREQLIKQTIIDTLSDNIKEIQYDLKENENENGSKAELILCDHTQSLCATIEAIFLHGLKDSFLSQTFNVLSGGEVNRKPAPNFWPPLLLFSHRHAIEQIHSFSQITTDIGYCRCWVRQTLNDCILSSYIANIRKSSQALVPYYKSSAFVRDSDYMELAQNFIGGIEACVTFNLSLNSSLLNNWTDPPLQLSGIYVPPLVSCPIASGIDVVNSTDVQQRLNTSSSAMNADRYLPIPRSMQLDQCYMSPITNSPFKHVANVSSHFHDDSNSDEAGIDCSQEISDDIEHDVRLNALLSKVDEMISKRDANAIEDEECREMNEETPEPIVEATVELSESRIFDGDDEDHLHEDSLSVEGNQRVGNLLSYNRGWSTLEEEEENIPDENIIPNTDTSAQSDNEENSLSTTSRRKYIYRRSQNVLSHNIDFEEVWKRFEDAVGIKHPEISPAKTRRDIELEGEDNDSNYDSNLDEYVVVQDETDRLLKKFSLKELREMIQQIYIIPRQLGLDAQNFACVSCDNPLGVGAAGVTTAQLCAFTGFYFCASCMAHEMHEIPSRVINNWDFQKYPISQRAAAFLHEFRYHAFIDMKILNPDIYRYVNEMSELQSLRIQLNFIRSYLFTCCASIVESLRKQLCNREYLYEHIHRYSLNDVENIPKGILAEQMRKVISFGKQHIFSCTLCSQKGYICEICQSDKILYPFDVHTTMKCDQCGSVFHASCCAGSSTGPEACPKCRRQRIRQHESYLT